MHRSLPYLVVVFAGCGLAAHQEPEPATGPPELNFPVGHFSLTERSGRTITEQDLRGSVWVASFVFTRCMGPCPQVTATVARLQQELQAEPDVKFVTFTVDPTTDNAGKLREYARHFHADSDRWWFLTGDEATIHKLMREQFKQAVERKSGEDVKPGDEFGHSTRLLLVDKKGLIRYSFDGLANDQVPNGPELFENNLKSLRKHVRELAQE